VKVCSQHAQSSLSQPPQVLRFSFSVLMIFRVTIYCNLKTFSLVRSRSAFMHIHLFRLPEIEFSKKERERKSINVCISSSPWCKKFSFLSPSPLLLLPLFSLSAHHQIKFTCHNTNSMEAQEERKKTVASVINVSLRVCVVAGSIRKHISTAR
jgi:hypothetical protein